MVFIDKISDFILDSSDSVDVLYFEFLLSKDLICFILLYFSDFSENSSILLSLLIISFSLFILIVLLSIFFSFLSLKLFIMFISLKVFVLNNN